MRWWASVAVGAAMVMAASPAMSQRRDAGTATGVFKIRLETPVQFGELKVPAHSYRLTLGPDGFVLADVSTMVSVATLPVERTTMQETVARASAKVERNGDTVTIVLRFADEQVRASGTVTELQAPSEGSLVKLAGKTERILDKGGPNRASDAALVRKALNRYLRSVKHCADAAHRGRWKTDDPRFVRCICPIVAKWRLPKVQKRLRVHQPLSKGRSGFSFSVTSEGKTDACRVWTGASPPPGARKPAPTPAPDASAARPEKSAPAARPAKTPAETP